MKLPSIQRLAAAAWATAQRFPVVLVCAIVAAVGATRAIEGEGTLDDLRIVAAASLGLPLLTGLTLFAERRRLGAWQRWALQALGVAALALFYWRWPNWSESATGLRYFQLSATLHLFVAFIAYLGVRESNGFWQFNRTLFFRFGLGVIYTYVLWGGLSVAMLGMDNLFGMDIDEESYPQLLFLLGFVFQTWFVLSGVPRDFERLDRRDDYPAGLRVFAQYVLLPLVAVYLTILTAYLGRVVITTTWPSGWIGYLVSALAAFGIFSLLLVHPRRGQEDHAWIDTYARVFWIVILPAVAMLLLAIGQRIGQYGITEPRYMLLVLAIWLAGTALFYTVSRSREIKGIPLSLAVIGLVTYVGPWSAFDVAERSQVGRLESLLSAHGVLREGRIFPAAIEVPNEDWRQINDVLRYLVEWHGTAGIDAWFEGGLAAVDPLVEWTGPSPGAEVLSRATLIGDHLGLVPAGGLLLGPRGFVDVSPSDGRDAAVPVSGFDHATFDVDLFEEQRVLEADTLEFAATTDSLGTTVRLGGMEIGTALFNELIARAERSGTPTASGRAQLPPDSLRLELSGADLTVRIHVTGLRLQQTENGALKPVRASGTVLLRRDLRLRRDDDTEP
ncbi:DUF4153 domain-containing protein [Candidatus Palauibacter sp.]|uniref:DUF4153 domain-containing protein n=1 Tax=Candidatus Palauibacter sp. TaxID=3101350 RepID=UPI003B5BF447